MSQWQTGDGFGASSLSRELLQSWTNQDEQSNTTTASSECWAPQVKPSSFHFDPSLLGHFQVAEQPLATRFDPQPLREESPLAARLELTNADRLENSFTQPREATQAGKDTSPLSQIYNILDVHSDSSRWLDQRGYLEAFKSPDCTLDLNFGTDARGSKIGAVMTAPCGSRRTVVACEGGTTFQRLTGANGQELVKFLSNGQIVELDPKRSSLA